MDNVVGNLTTELSSANLWAQFGSAVPLIAVVTLFSLGLFFVRKAIKGGSKGKAGSR